MSQELKAYNVVATADVNPEVVDRLGCVEWTGYDKSEVDKVFRRLKARLAHKGISNQRLEADKNNNWRKYCAAMAELRHQKYKRCLAMTEMCEARYDEEDAKVNGYGASWEYISKEIKYWERWRQRWLELAEKFKEAK